MPVALDGTALALGGETAALRAAGRAGGDALRGDVERLCEQLHEPLFGGGAIRSLAAFGLRDDAQLTVGRETILQAAGNALPLAITQGRALLKVE